MSRDSEEIKDAYNKIARAYAQKRKNPNESPWNNYLEIPAMGKLLRPLVSGASVLDLGCGTGLLTQEIQSLGARTVMGIDQSQEMIRIAKKESPDLNFQIGSCEKLPFKAGSFELVASSLMIHYLQDLKPTFREVRRVLGPSGSFVFSMHHPIHECFQNLYMQGEAPLESRQFGPYFHNKGYHWKMCGADILSFHHTFEDIVNDLHETGFSTQKFVETRPEPTVNFPGIDHTRNYPTFLVVWAQAR